ncbi:MAG: ATP-binding protein, partial [Bacteroidota bacterium]
TAGAAPWVASADLEVDGTDPSAVRQALMRGRLARSGPLALAALSIVEMPPDPHRPVQHELERTGPAGVDASLTGALRAGHALVRRSEQGQAITTDELEALMALLREGVDHVRALSHTFRAPGAGACPLVPALQDLLASAQRAAGFTGRLDVEAAWPPFKESAVRHLIRIAQEAVTHALKHAQARHLVLRVGQEGGRLFLQIEDDGAGRPTGAQQAAHGLGLRTMQYRAACLGARLTVETPPSGGTSVTCWLPPLPGLVVEAASTTVFPSPAPPRAHVSPLHCG